MRAENIRITDQDYKQRRIDAIIGSQDLTKEVQRKPHNLATLTKRAEQAT